jgi:hypothetical protein
MLHEWGEEECIHDIGGIARRKEPLERPRHRWVDNIKMDLRGIGWFGMDFWFIWVRIGTSGGLLSTR